MHVLVLRIGLHEVHQPVLLGLGVSGARMDKSEFAHPTKPAIGVPEQGDDDLFALVPLVQPVRPRVPDGHRAGSVLAPGDAAVESQVLQRMIFGAYREMVDFRVGRRCFGHRPTCQDTVALQPDVVVQSTRMVFLDDESEAISLLIRRPGGHGLRCLGRVAHAAVDGEPIPFGVRRQGSERVTKIGQSRQHLLVLQLPQALDLPAPARFGARRPTADPGRALSTGTRWSWRRCSGSNR